MTAMARAIATATRAVTARATRAGRTTRRIATSRRGGVVARATRVEAEIVRSAGVLYDDAVVGDDDAYEATLDEKAATLRAYAEAIEGARRTRRRRRRRRTRRRSGFDRRWSSESRPGESYNRRKRRCC